MMQEHHHEKLCFVFKALGGVLSVFGVLQVLMTSAYQVPTLAPFKVRAIFAQS
jgi:hypothetical protein